MTYDSDNIFAKILRGDIPCHNVYEDNNTLCFMDIMPRVNGHCLVIPKAEVRNILDCPVDVLHHVMSVVQVVGRACVRAFDADGLTIQQFSEEAGGQEVFHLHFHVMPRHNGIKLFERNVADHAVLADHAQRIRTALSEWQLKKTFTNESGSCAVEIYSTSDGKLYRYSVDLRVLSGKAKEIFFGRAYHTYPKTSGLYESLDVCELDARSIMDSV